MTTIATYTKISMKRNMFLSLGCVIIALLCIVLLFFGLLAGGYNRLVQSSTNVDTAWAQVQTDYQRRSDLIPNLVRTVEGAANFEKSTLSAVIEARASATKVTIDPSKAPTDPAQLQQFQQAQDAVSSTLGRLLAVSERYPELKTSSNFRDLQAQIEGTENRIAIARQDFNKAAQSYNVQVRSFPTVLYSRILGFEPKPFFQSTSGAEKPPEVNFPSFGGSPAPATTH